MVYFVNISRSVVTDLRPSLLPLLVCYNEGSLYKAYDVCHSVVIRGVDSHLTCNYIFYDEGVMSGAILTYTTERGMY
jgi:hypothetical protein